MFVQFENDRERYLLSASATTPRSCRLIVLFTQRGFAYAAMDTCRGPVESAWSRAAGDVVSGRTVGFAVRDIRNMNILFVGGVLPRELEDVIRGRSPRGVQDAANTLQWNVIGGIESVMHAPVSILSAMFVGVFPGQYRDAWVKSFGWHHAAGADDYSVPFLNLFAIRNVSREYHLLQSAETWLKKCSDKEDNVIIAYSVHGPFLGVLAYAKRKRPWVKTCLIAPDLPEYMIPEERKTLLYRMLKSLDRRVIDRRLRSVDCFVVLTQYMKDALHIERRPSVVVEGMAELGMRIAAVQDCDAVKCNTIAYTGTLEKRYGILDLVESLKYLEDPKCELILAGYGDAVGEIEDAARHDSRIRLVGMVSHEEALSIQRSATVLVNPRPNIGAYTKYSFPSKTLEYLSSGRPVVMYRLDGVPAEYDPYLVYIDGNGPWAIAEALKRILSRSRYELNEWGKRGQNFALYEKNNTKQAERIMNMIGSL